MKGLVKIYQEFCGFSRAEKVGIIKMLGPLIAVFVTGMIFVGFIYYMIAGLAGLVIFFSVFVSGLFIPRIASGIIRLVSLISSQISRIRR